MPTTNTWATYRFHVAVVCVCGGHVTSVPVDCRTSGWLKSTAGKAWIISVLFVSTGNFATDVGSKSGILLGHSQEWGDTRSGDGRQSHTQALALPGMQPQMASTRDFEI